MEIAILALGCFWGPEQKFSKIDGIIRTEVGYCGGNTENTTYKDVCTGTTNHAEVVKLEYDEKTIPNTYILKQNYPNPFNPSTQIQFSVPNSENVHLIIYDALGNKVKEVFNKELMKGQYSFTWSGKNNEGEKVSSGIYFYRMEAGTFVKTKKMILLK